jgi:hypothetical protein
MGVIKSDEVMRVAPNSICLMSLSKEETGTDVHPGIHRRPCGDEGGIGREASASQEAPRLQQTSRCWKNAWAEGPLLPHRTLLPHLEPMCLTQDWG